MANYQIRLFDGENHAQPLPNATNGWRSRHVCGPCHTCVERVITFGKYDGRWAVWAAGVKDMISVLMYWLLFIGVKLVFVKGSTPKTARARECTEGLTTQ